MKHQFLKTAIVITGVILLFLNSNAQNVTITDDDLYSGENSAMLDVNCTSKGLLIPRLTNNDRDGISTPAAGLIIFNTETNCINFYNGTEWLELMGCGFPDAPDAITGTDCPYEFETGVTYSIDAVGNADSYTWTVPADATIVSGQGTTSITVDFGITNGNVSVRSENSCGNSSSYSTLAITLEPEPTCSDGILNGDETDVDCGGPDCPDCPSFNMCETYSDCISGVCVGGICQPPACDDGVQNGGETGVDCGGPDCPPCKK